MEVKKISELEVEDRIDGFFVIKSFEKKTAASGREYYDLDLLDDTGIINAKIWEIEKGEDISEGDFVKVRGEVISWKDVKQMKIFKARKVVESDDVKIEDYVQSAPIEAIKMYSEIMEYTEAMSSEDIKKLVETILLEKKDKLMYYPAAKGNHHAIRSGLLYHMLRMLRAGAKLLEVYDGMNSDLVYAGVILHDLAKIEEMEANELGIVSDYTKEGKLLGHIIQGIKEIDRVARENGIDGEISLVIQHMILSHHYYPEHGSPRYPMIPEGELLHYLDIIDARIYDMQKALSEVKEGEFTSRVWTLDNRQLYKVNKD
ncbi:3'-5' exoribonuclease YhaM [Andreesenia angusta]|uniref:3'-5' exoribonuclease YhaM n=1 Tax=Andreesenia angusta TaxID=39480 RepID=A0A1S1VAY6_9FIRM|nr:HD domain-containing protein [Andreesenia angusta]OHW62999.1 3'-5' exoribonuclease YhaM [Andreesenia angusta]